MTALGPIFIITLRAAPGSDGVHELRTLLKRLLRQHGFRALDVREKHDTANLGGDENG